MTKSLEDRVVATLASEGLIKRQGQGWRHAAVAVVAAGAGALAVLMAQTAGQESGPAGGETYMLALYTTADYQAEGADDGSRAREYGKWAASHQEGPAVVTGGEELGADRVELGPEAAGTEALAGFFLVRAASRADAVALARTNPHLRYGGTVVVRDVVE